ncbi:MAG TPA: glutaredoxin [Pyrinomonadaceae bacterium]|nr:glutaredoxin [Pyrinomonadaceae bacterium]
MSIVMYVKPGCPYCQRARDYYNENKIPFVEYDAQNDKARQREMLEYTGGDVTVPAIVQNGQFLQSGWGDPPRG